jgi:sentrin-specific protease 8
VYQSEDRILFISPEVTQCIKCSVGADEANLFLDPLRADERAFIFLAVNNNNNSERAGGSHWSLLVFSKPENAFYHFDSSGHSNWSSALELYRIMKQVLHCSTADFIDGGCLQQNNCYDCGIHLLCNVDEILKSIAKSGTVADSKFCSYGQVKTKRGELLNLILDLGGRSS